MDSVQQNYVHIQSDDSEEYCIVDLVIVSSRQGATWVFSKKKSFSIMEMLIVCLHCGVQEEERRGGQVFWTSPLSAIISIPFFFFALLTCQATKSMSQIKH